MASPTPDARTRDADIALHLAQGELDAAFDTLVARYATKVFRLCCTLLNDEAAAQDATQDTLLRIWRALGSYREERAALSTWVYAITRNRCFTLIEQRQTQAATTTPLEAAWAEVENLPAPTPAVDEADSQALLRRLVAALPEVPRQCLQLYYYEERAVAEVAEQLGLPQGTVKTHLHRARAQLLQGLKAAGLGEAQQWLQA